jgi:hypothetical protein
MTTSRCYLLVYILHPNSCREIGALTPIGAGPMHRALHRRLLHGLSHTLRYFTRLTGLAVLPCGVSTHGSTDMCMKIVRRMCGAVTYQECGNGGVEKGKETRIW